MQALSYGNTDFCEHPRAASRRIKRSEIVQVQPKFSPRTLAILAARITDGVAVSAAYFSIVPFGIPESLLTTAGPDVHLQSRKTCALAGLPALPPQPQRSAIMTASLLKSEEIPEKWSDVDDAQVHALAWTMVEGVLDNQTARLTLLHAAAMLKATLALDREDPIGVAVNFSAGANVVRLWGQNISTVTYLLDAFAFQR